jgi:hypothetical protein
MEKDSNTLGINRCNRNKYYLISSASAGEKSFRCDFSMKDGNCGLLNENGDFGKGACKPFKEFNKEKGEIDKPIVKP